MASFVVSYRAMKTVHAKSNPKDVIHAGSKSGHGTGVIRDRDGRISSRGQKGIAQKAPVSAMPAAIAYDAEDVEEPNRIGAALCRQHAR